MASDLLPCPFCGADMAARDTHAVIAVIMHRIKCRECGAGTRWYDSAGQAIAAWNRRSPAPAEAGRE